MVTVTAYLHPGVFQPPKGSQRHSTFPANDYTTRRSRQKLALIGDGKALADVRTLRDAVVVDVGGLSEKDLDPKSTGQR